jgi:hypothetical protein
MCMYQTSRHHIQEHDIFHIYYRENLEKLPSKQLCTREHNRSDFKKKKAEINDEVRNAFSF